MPARLDLPHPTRAFSERTIATLLREPLFVGLLLRRAIQLEHQLDQTLALFYFRTERLDAGLEQVISALTLSRKVELLAKLPIPRRIKSRKAAVSGLRRFVELRNLIAHQHRVSLARVRNLLKDPAKRAMFSVVAELENEARKVSQALERMARTHAFGPGAKTRADELMLRDAMDFIAETDSRVGLAVAQAMQRAGSRAR